MPTLGSILPTLRRSGSSDITVPPAGWIGATAATKGDIVTVDGTGKVNQSATAGNNVGAIRVAFLGQNVAATAAVGTLVQIEKFDDDTLIALPALAADAATPTLASHVGQQYDLRRVSTTGYYGVNTSATSVKHVEVVAIDPRYPVGESGGMLLCRVLAGSRVA